jgi:glycosyltransferase involved in cell wall biosynthesis
MKILTIVQSFGMGGTQQVASNYARAYAGLGFASAALGIYGGGHHEQQLEEAGVRVFRGERNVPESLRVLKNWRPDLIHIHGGGAHEPVNSWLLRELKSETTKVIQTNVFGRVDYTSAQSLIDVELLLSNWCAWKWQKWWGPAGTAPAHLVFPNFLEENIFHVPTREERREAKKSLGIPPDAVVLGRVGQKNMGKWHGSIFRVFKELRARLPEARLLLVGCPDELIAKARNQCPDLDSHIVLQEQTTSRQELQQAYEAMDIFVHASLIGESFGLVLAEAAQCGLPIVTLNTPFHDNTQFEMVRFLNSGVAAFSEIEMLETLKVLAQDEKKRGEIGLRSALKVNAAFGLNRHNRERLAGLAETVVRSHDGGQAVRVLNERWQENPFFGTNSIEPLVAETRSRLGLVQRLGFDLLHCSVPYRLYRGVKEYKFLRKQCALIRQWNIQSTL